jgi:hypothetical protein
VIGSLSVSLPTDGARASRSAAAGRNEPGLGGVLEAGYGAKGSAVEGQEHGRPASVLVDPERLRSEVREKYREVAAHPHGEHHFHTGRPLAARLGYPSQVVDALPDAAVESFAGVGNPFSLRDLQPGEHVVDIGSGAGLDSFVAATLVATPGA